MDLILFFVCEYLVLLIFIEGLLLFFYCMFFIFKFNVFSIFFLCLFLVIYKGLMKIILFYMINVSEVYFI